MQCKEGLASATIGLVFPHGDSKGEESVREDMRHVNFARPAVITLKTIFSITFGSLLSEIRAHNFHFRSTDTTGSREVGIAEWLDGHLGSSRSRVETLLE